MEYKDIQMKNSEIFEKVELDKNNRVPLYYQISNIIREQIDSGILKPGDQILTEEKIQKKFNVSRATVRRAISELVYDGLLDRQYSKGTMVAYPKAEDKLENLCSFTVSILRSNQSLRTHILKFEIIREKASITSKLEIDKDALLVHINRVRYIDEKPICVEDWYCPYDYFKEMNIDMFEEEGMNQSTYHILQKHFGVIVGRIQDTMSGVAINSEEARLLGVHVGVPAILRKRITYDEKGRAIIYSSGRYIIKVVIDQDIK